MGRLHDFSSRSLLDEADVWPFGLGPSIRVDPVESSTGILGGSAILATIERWREPPEELARLVIRHRAALGMSQEELARRVGTSHSTISRIESGRHKTSVETLQTATGAPIATVSPPN